MDWNAARSLISKKITPGTDLNTENSTYREVIQVNKIINSRLYGYRNELGFYVSIGKTAKINIPWSMLRVCFEMLASPSGYNGTGFRDKFPEQASIHPCHVHVVGQLFVRTGIAFLREGSYFLVDHPGKPALDDIRQLRSFLLED